MADCRIKPYGVPAGDEKKTIDSGLSIKELLTGAFKIAPNAGCQTAGCVQTASNRIYNKPCATPHP